MCIQLHAAYSMHPARTQTAVHAVIARQHGLGEGGQGQGEGKAEGQEAKLVGHRKSSGRLEYPIKHSRDRSCGKANRGWPRSLRRRGLEL